MNEWQEVKLGDIVYYYNNKIDRNFVDKYNYISTDNLLPNKCGKINASSIPQIKRLNSYKKNHILLSNIRTYFKKIYFTENDGGCSSDVLVFEAKNNNISKYIYYIFSQDAFFNYVSSGSKGTKMPRGDKEHILNFKIKLPPLPTQKRIADILSSLDNKIEINNKINKTLENISEALFKEWFINFNFPNSEGKPYKDSGGKMIESSLGDIPEGFRVGTISDLTNQTFTGDWGKDKKENSYTEEVVCIRGADIDNMCSGDSGNPVTRFILKKKLKSKQLEISDIVIECSGGSPTQSTGRCLLITDKLLSYFNKPLICTNFCRVIKIKNEIYSNFLYSMLRYLYKTDLFFLYENGTTGIKNLDISSLFNKYQIVIPSEELVFNYRYVINSLMNYIDNNREENQKLGCIRDLLLPKLMSGEIKV